MKNQFLTSTLLAMGAFLASPAFADLAATDSITIDATASVETPTTAEATDQGAVDIADIIAQESPIAPQPTYVFVGDMPVAEPYALEGGVALPQIMLVSGVVDEVIESQPDYTVGEPVAMETPTLLDGEVKPEVVPGEETVLVDPPIQEEPKPVDSPVTENTDTEGTVPTDPEIYYSVTSIPKTIGEPIPIAMEDSVTSINPEVIRTFHVLNSATGAIKQKDAAHYCQGVKATIIGTAQADNLTGTAKRDVIVGLGGNDNIYGLGGNDLICGGDGDDKLFGGLGKDSIQGDNGNDNIQGQDGHDRLVGNAGDDHINGGAGVDNINGGDGDDFIAGEAGNDKLSGDAGLDMVLGGPGADNLAGGMGEDAINGGPGNDVIAGGNDTDILNGGDGNDTVKGENGDDRIYGSAGRDHLSGGKGNDDMSGEQGDDAFDGGVGADKCKPGKNHGSKELDHHSHCESNR